MLHTKKSLSILEENPLRLGVVSELLMQFWVLLREAAERVRQCPLALYHLLEVTGQNASQLQYVGVLGLNVAQGLNLRLQLHVDGARTATKAL